MGGRNSCQGKRCREEPYGICECKSIMLCALCFEIHKEENPKTVHKFILMKEPVQGSQGEEKPITWKSLIFLKKIYKSPEGTTEVHEAMVKDRPGKYAVKVMYCKNEAQLQKKQKESALQMKLSHPNICMCRAAFLDTTYKSGFKFVILMDFSENGDMDEEINKRMLHKSPWTELEIFNHITQLIDAFAYLQAANLTHGDIKPKNLYLASDGRIKIGDFGESKQSLQVLVTRTYQVAGTVIYFSPLLFRAYLDIIKGKNSSGDVRHNPIKSDVFSLGLSFLHMASLTRPIELNDLDIGEDILQQKIERIIGRIEYSDKLKNLLRMMLQVKESKRCDFVSLNEFLHPTELVKTPENPYKQIRRESSLRSQEFKLIATSQTQGKAYALDVNGKLTTFNNNKFQSSSRVILCKESAIVTGGLKNSKSVFRINLATCTAVKLNDMQESRSWHSLLWFNKAIFAIAGRSDQKEPLASTEKLSFTEDSFTGLWETAESLEIGRENATAICMNDCVYVIGGSYKVGGRLTLMDGIEKYEGNLWKCIAVKLPYPMSGVGAVFNENGVLIIVGGTREKGVVGNEAFEINVEKLEITHNPRLNIIENDFFGSQSAMAVDTKLYLMGSLAGCHMFDGNLHQWEVIKYK